MDRIIGIDFGTSTTYMNVKRYNGCKPAEDRFSYMPVVFNYGESSGFVASVVRENADGTFDFGKKATEQLEGATIYTGFKMLLESPDEQARSTARRIIKEFFKYLYETYTQQSANLGSADDTEETLVSYPVKWSGESIGFMLEAAREAGFKNVRGMDEATAAVSTVLCQNRDLIRAGESGYLLLVDMGAGTTDLVVCRYEADSNQNILVKRVLSWPQNAQEPTFGGREIDTILEKYVEDYLTKALSSASASQAHVIAASPGQAKAWKELTVSNTLADNKPVTTCAYIGPYKSLGMLNGNFPAFGRDGFEQMAKSELQDYCKLLLGCLRAACKENSVFSLNGLDLVILTGGHSAWYFAREIVDGTMEGYLEHPALTRIRSEKHRVVNLANPQTTVSLGLVYSRLSEKMDSGSSGGSGGGSDGSSGGGSGGSSGGGSSGGSGGSSGGGSGGSSGGGSSGGSGGSSGGGSSGGSGGSSDGSSGGGSSGGSGGISGGSSGGGSSGGSGGSSGGSSGGGSGEDWGPAYDSSICPNCGSRIPDKKKRCPVCKRHRLPILKTPFKLGLISMYIGEKRLGIATATGTFTIYDDRVEYNRKFGNTAALLTPYTAVYSAVKANLKPKEIFWMKDIVDVKEGVYGIGATSIVITMRQGEKYTFTGFSKESGKDKAKAVVELIRQKCGG